MFEHNAERKKDEGCRIIKIQNRFLKRGSETQVKLRIKMIMMNDNFIKVMIIIVMIIIVAMLVSSNVLFIVI